MPHSSFCFAQKSTKKATVLFQSKVGQHKHKHKHKYKHKCKKLPERQETTEIKSNNQSVFLLETRVQIQSIIKQYNLQI